MADQLVKHSFYSGSEFNKSTKNCIFVKTYGLGGRDGKAGLNKIDVPFNPEQEFGEDWTETGISFMEIEDLANYYCEFMRMVIIPDDAKIFVFSRTHFTADKLFFDEKYRVCTHPLFDDPKKCFASVSKNPMNLKFVANKTAELCKLAVEKNGKVLREIRDMTADLCKISIKQDWRNIQYVHSWNLTNEKERDEICILALELAIKEPDFSLSKVPIDDKEQAQKCWLMLLERSNKISKKEITKMKQAHDNWKMLLKGRMEGIAKL